MIETLFYIFTTSIAHKFIKLMSKKNELYF